MTVEDLIAEMQQVKLDHPTLEVADVLRIFNIQALKDLTFCIGRFSNGR